MMQSTKNKHILGACLDSCVHVAGITNFFKIAQENGYQTSFLGPACSIDKIIYEIQHLNPYVVALSFRLTPDVGFEIIKNFISEIHEKNLSKRIFLLGCLPALKEKIIPLNFFKHIFIGGESPSYCVAILEDKDPAAQKKNIEASNLLSRLKLKSPNPIYRTHFGLNSLEQSLEEIKKIAKSKLVDVISIAPDQPAQEYFHRKDVLEKCDKGAGGIPIRTTEDLQRIYASAQVGNYPLLRIYAGTQDLILNSKVQLKYLKNAWTATPIFWYSDLDGRSKRPLKLAIQENLENIMWHAHRNLPVEINDPHQWGLRAAPDHIVVADAFLCAKIAKELGVKTYIQQLMFNTPVGNSLNMDLGRVLAMIEVVEPLKSPSFDILKETRAGLSYFSNNPDEAKAQLALSTLFQMAVKPSIIHIVNYCEANHAAKAQDIIVSAQIAKKVVEEVSYDPINLTNDPEIQRYKNELIKEARITLSAIEDFGESHYGENYLLTPEFLTSIVENGFFDAPHLKNDSSNFGNINSKIIDGKCICVTEDGHRLLEKDRIRRLFSKFEQLDVKSFLSNSPTC
ncbi:hypothetical protein NEF87_000260 [Candidatus Lokiarchaeum ossiferum]|uniref:B12-binding domain-containing protein n=1 Tax=Candidatus Lokiarchaeum ossiferum TaxID=2951803 RepID=A0ABY6HKC5_9ARCH|nr:hypothetical protein NEF87_000260 [Candidatus Lokiarchaeum sp. B-35]